MTTANVVRACHVVASANSLTTLSSAGAEAKVYRTDQSCSRKHAAREKRKINVRFYGSKAPTPSVRQSAMTDAL